MIQKKSFSSLLLFPVLCLFLLESCVHPNERKNEESLVREIANSEFESEPLNLSKEPIVKLEEDFYQNKVQPIFNNRCVACHSCFTSPCQLNLTSFAGVDRGALKDDLYNFRDIGEKTPTRLGIDVPQSLPWETITQKWREEKYVGSDGTFGFFPVINRSVIDEKDRLSTSNLAQMLILKEKYSQKSNTSDYFLKPFDSENSRMCPINNNKTKKISDEMKAYHSKFSWAGMPYGFPKLTLTELSDLLSWVKAGSPPNSDKAEAKLSQPSKPNLLGDWESFFNQTDFTHKITARYIYEHLFLAHIYFDELPGEFFRLIRAECDIDGKNCYELPTRRPTDDPRSSTFYTGQNSKAMMYRFQKVTQTLVHKAHIPYQLNNSKLKRWKKLFIEAINEQENFDKVQHIFPKYGNLAAGNPFFTFKDIPAKSRYQFLLDDSYFFVNSFIKGPVCRGSGSLSVIDDHFWVFFLKPESDVTIKNSEFFSDAGEDLAVPALDGNDWTFYQIFTQRRRTARMTKQKYLDEKLEVGFGLTDIWNGDSDGDGEGENQNAVLTIYRHEDSASVSKGAIGESPKTMWLLDYPIFEDIYYNLVGTYDVYAPIIHSVKSRLHMDASRFNGQDMFLSLIPKEQRLAIRSEWTRERIPQKNAPTCRLLPAQLCAFYTQSAETMRDVVYPYAGHNKETQIEITKSNEPQKEIAAKILNWLPLKVTQETKDTINNKKPLEQNEISQKLINHKTLNMNEVEEYFAIFAGQKGLFASNFPELTYIQVVDSKTNYVEWYTLIHNRERYNVAFFEEIVPEKERVWPEKDSLNIVKGFIGSYANAILTVPVNRIPEFVSDILKLGNDNTINKFYRKYLVSRFNPQFWTFYDNMTAATIKEGSTLQSDRFEGAIIDLNRYTNLKGL